jgi:chemotaxis protein methyltransferase WspC
VSAKDSDRTAERLLAERIGLDPESLGAGAIARALRVRMAALGLQDRDAYLRQLSSSESELQELVEEVVVPESWFFRDERPFAALRDYVSARRDGAVNGVPVPTVRLLSIPCGRGEEPYSIAITLRDLGLTSGRFQIDAVDVSARHLAAAERGVYRAHSFRGKDLGFRDRYFQPSVGAQSFTLDAALRATVRFTRGNLLDPDLLDGQPAYDVIFCRNVLIYFDAASRRRALATLDRLLGRDGLLFVGHAERPALDDPRFEPYGDNAGFTLRRAETGQRERAREAPASPPPRPRQPVPPSVQRSVDRPSETPAANPPVPVPECSATLLAEAAALADRGRYDEAAARCDTMLHRFGPSAPVFFLRGVVHQAAGQVAEAEADYRKTIYLEPGHDEAMLALALIAQRRGDPDTAAAYRRRADRARAKKGTS